MGAAAARLEQLARGHVAVAGRHEQVVGDERLDALVGQRGPEQRLVVAVQHARPRLRLLAGDGREPGDEVLLERRADGVVDPVALELLAARGRRQRARLDDAADEAGPARQQLARVVVDEHPAHVDGQPAVVRAAVGGGVLDPQQPARVAAERGLRLDVDEADRLERGVEGLGELAPAAVRAPPGAGRGGVGVAPRRRRRVDRLAADEHRHVEQRRSSGRRSSASVPGPAAGGDRRRAPARPRCRARAARRRRARSARRSCCGTRTPSPGALCEVERTRVRSAMMNADRKPSPNRPIRSSSASPRSRASRVAPAPIVARKRATSSRVIPAPSSRTISSPRPGSPSSSIRPPSKPGSSIRRRVIESCAFWTSSRTATAGRRVQVRAEDGQQPPEIDLRGVDPRFHAPNGATAGGLERRSVY